MYNPHEELIKRVREYKAFLTELKFPLEMSIRTHRVLVDNNINTAWQLLQCTETKLKKFKNMGAKSLTECKKLIVEYSHLFKDEFML